MTTAVEIFSADDLEPDPIDLDLQAEMIVLGACLLSSKAIAEAVEIVRTNDFQDARHILIFDTILDIFGRGGTVDLATVSHDLAIAGDLDAVGGTVYLHRLISSIPPRHHASDLPGFAIDWARAVAVHAWAIRVEDAAHGLVDAAAIRRVEVISAAYGAVYTAVRDGDVLLSTTGSLIVEPVESGTTTALYRWFDDDDRLLYIGISGDVFSRQSSHAKRSTWAMDFAARGTIERFPTRDVALEAERLAIQAELPLFNHQHNDTLEAKQRLVAYLVERGRHDLLAPAVSRG